jgi:hypothetical protein
MDDDRTNDNPPDMNMHHVDAIYAKVLKRLTTAVEDAKAIPCRDTRPAAAAWAHAHLYGLREAVRLVKDLHDAETYQSGDQLGGL